MTGADRIWAYCSDSFVQPSGALRSRQIAIKKAVPLAGVLAVLTAYFGARLGYAGGGVPSPFEAAAGEIVSYYREYATFTAISAYLYCLSAIFLVVFGAGVWDRLRSSESADVRTWAVVGLAGSAVYAVLLLLIGIIVFSLVGLAQRDGSAEALAGLSVVWATSAVILVPASVPMLLGFGMAYRRSKIFSGLLANFALIGVVLGLLPPPEVIGPASPPAANVAFVLSQLQPWMLVLWMLGTAFVLRRAQVPGLAEAEPEESNG